VSLVVGTFTTRAVYAIGQQNIFVWPKSLKHVLKSISLWSWLDKIIFHENMAVIVWRFIFLHTYICVFYIHTYVFFTYIHMCFLHTYICVCQALATFIRVSGPTAFPTDQVTKIIFFRPRRHGLYMYVVGVFAHHWSSNPAWVCIGG
jgi:hypothetical protein